MIADADARARLDAPSFTPKRWLGNGHAMTLYAWARTRMFPALPPAEERRIRVAPNAQVLAHCYWQPDRAQRPTLLALHGLEGSSQVHYMRGLADKAWRRGWNAVLLNQRNCGGTEALAPGLYHSGLTADPREVIRTLVETDHLPSIAIAGYSLGGNLALKLAGELGDSGVLPVRAVAAVSPTIELEQCVRAIERRVNYPYQWNFVRNLKARLRRMAATWPGVYDLTLLNRIWTIRRFDDVYTAPHHGYQGATDYYTRASAMRVVSQIRIPALIVSGADDPFVPAEQFLDPALAANPSIQVSVQRLGGHCGFVADPAGPSDGYWAEDAAVAFLAAAMPG